MSKMLTDFKVLTFDCYGTLIDWESGIWDALQPLIFRNNRENITRRIALEEFAILETEQEASTPDMLYPKLLSRVHRRIARNFGMESNEELDHAFGLSVPYWPAFPDSADALRKLRHQFKLVILSNVNRNGFSESNKKLGVEFDAVYTAEDIGSYKPDVTNFEYMLAHLKSDFDLEAHQILHTAQSLHHDHVPATKIGLSKAWIDRQNLANSDDWGATAIVANRPNVDYRFSTLMEMAECI